MALDGCSQSIEQGILEALNWRYAVKRYEVGKKIPPSAWHTLCESMRLAPSSYGMEPFRFLVIENSELRAKLRAASWNQSQVTDCSHFVVFTTKDVVTEGDVDQYLERIVETRGVAPESLGGLKKMLVKNLIEGMTPEQSLHWSQRQAYIAMGFLLETAALLHIDATPLEGLDPAQYDRLLDLTGSGWRTVAAVALGYRHPDDAFQRNKKVRLASEEIFEIR